MDLGIHLPQVARAGSVPSGQRVRQVAALAARLDFAAVCANDHLAFRRPWLDGLTALAAVSSITGSLQLATTVALPAVRGPVQLAATVAALDALAPGRVVAAVGAGSSATDHALAGLPFDRRWTTFEEAVAVLRALLSGQPLPEGWAERLGDQVPASAVATGPVPIWVAAWGSPAGLRRVARLGDGWLASAYHTTPAELGAARVRLDRELTGLGRDPGAVPSALATMWTWVTDDDRRAEEVLRTEVAPLVGLPVSALRGRLCVGTARTCAELLAQYQDAGCARVHLWPLGDEVTQLHRITEEVVPLLDLSSPSANPARPRPPGG